MYYKLTFDMDIIDVTMNEGKNYIYAEAANIDEIETESCKKGSFDNIILSNKGIKEWPIVEFYYSSQASNRESDYLLNVKGWPIIHTRVTEALKEIKGIKFYPIKLVDIVTNAVNTNYFLMYIENFIDAFDMKKSQYRYNEKYNLYTFLPKGVFLDYETCSRYDIFRCEKSVAGIYVSSVFSNIIQENNFSGFKFVEQL
ncbi:MAG: hypothetical protein NC393_09515 [Clostridium sp.]|nr:hypothetical protein [Clostridium sp.]MCM1172350.1 hypothetical protein [Clostridium sp.]